MNGKQHNTQQMKHKFFVASIVFTASFFIFLFSIWIKNTYGELLIATTDVSFLNWFENKRRLVLLEVCVPTAFIFFALLIGGSLLAKKMESSKWKWILRLELILSFAIIVFGGSYLKAGDYFLHQIHLSGTQWYDNNKVVIHALGEIDGHAYTNSGEALEKSYSMGNTIFECDFSLTSDDKLVACHDWNTGFQEGFSEDNIPTKDLFMQVKILGKYTPVSIDEIVRFMEENQEVYIVTDTKYAEAEFYNLQFGEIVDTAVKNDCEDILKRFIIQIYHPYMYEDINKIYQFDNYIYTLYQEVYRGDIQEMEEYAMFCRQHDIDVITMNAEYYSDELLDICDRYGLQLFVHTVNDEEMKKSFLEKKVGIYTDSFDPFDWQRL